MCEYAWENGKAERINGVIKNNYLIHRDIRSFEYLVKEVDRSVYLYNFEKLHIKLQRKTPNEFENDYICSGQQSSDSTLWINSDYEKNALSHKDFAGIFHIFVIRGAHILHNGQWLLGSDLRCRVFHSLRSLHYTSHPKATAVCSFPLRYFYIKTLKILPVFQLLYVYEVLPPVLMPAIKQFRQT